MEELKIDKMEFERIAVGSRDTVEDLQNGVKEVAVDS